MYNKVFDYNNILNGRNTTKIPADRTILNIVTKQ